MPSLTLTVSYFIKMIFSLIFYAYSQGRRNPKADGPISPPKFLLSDTKVKTDQMRFFYDRPPKLCTFRRHYFLFQLSIYSHSRDRPLTANIYDF